MQSRRSAKQLNPGKIVVCSWQCHVSIQCCCDTTPGMRLPDSAAGLVSDFITHDSLTIRPANTLGMEVPGVIGCLEATRLGRLKFGPHHKCSCQEYLCRAPLIGVEHDLPSQQCHIRSHICPAHAWCCLLSRLTHHTFMAALDLTSRAAGGGRGAGLGRRG
jgi:hypothetical protein